MKRSEAAQARKAPTPFEVERVKTRESSMRAADELGIMSRHDAITLSIGAEKFEGYDVGPIVLSVLVREGETPAAAYARARSVAEDLFELELAKRLADHARARGPEGFAKTLERAGK